MSEAPASTAELDQHRLEVSRLLLALLSKTMYMDTDDLRNPWAQYFVTKLSKQSTLAILCSYLNVVAKYDPVGWVPYNHMVFADSRETLFQASDQILVVLLNHTFGLRSLKDLPPPTPLAERNEAGYARLGGWSR